MDNLRDKASNYHIYNNMAISALKSRVKDLSKLKDELEKELQLNSVGIEQLNYLFDIKISKLSKRDLIDHVMALQNIFDSLYIEIMNSDSAHKQSFMTVINYR